MVSVAALLGAWFIAGKTGAKAQGVLEAQIAELRTSLDKHAEDVRRELDMIARDLRRDFEALSLSLDGMRREQRENNVRLYERWEKSMERLTKVETKLEALGRNGSA